MSGLDITGIISTCISSAIGLIVMDNLYWQSLPRTPYYLRKRINHLQNELLLKYCYVNEEVIRP